MVIVHDRKDCIRLYGTEAGQTTTAVLLATDVATWVARAAIDPTVRVAVAGAVSLLVAL